MKIKVLIIVLVIILLLVVGGFFFVSYKKGKAKEIILEDVNALEKDIDIINDGTEIDDFKLIYEMEFYFENVKYDYAVNLLTNEIVNYDQEGQNNTNNQSNNNQNNNNQTTNINQTDTNTTNTITSEEAKTIALEDAKVPSESVNNVIIEQDYNNGLLEYEIEFSFDQIRYEYTIDANGNIVSFDKEQIRS